MSPAGALWRVKIMSEKRYTDEQFYRLPKWAQRELESRELHVANLKAKIAELSSDHPDSNVKVNDFIHGDRGLPPDSHIDFYLGDGRVKYRNMISVQHLRTKDRNVLRVAASETLVITPGATNTVEISSQRI